MSVFTRHLLPTTVAVLSVMSFSAYAAPYSIPEPTLKACSDDRVLQELTDNISNGTLSGEDNLMASLNFVQSCQDMLYPEGHSQRQLPVHPQP